MVKCEYCGGQIKDEQRFCPDCGKPAEAKTAAKPAEGAEIQTAEPEYNAEKDAKDNKDAKDTKDTKAR